MPTSLQGEKALNSLFGFLFRFVVFVVVVVNTEAACSIFVVDIDDKGSIYCLPRCGSLKWLM